MVCWSTIVDEERVDRERAVELRRNMTRLGDGSLSIISSFVVRGCEESISIWPVGQRQDSGKEHTE
jgi:hypothetical protein